MQVNTDGGTGIDMFDSNSRIRLTHVVWSDNTVQGRSMDGGGVVRLQTGIDPQGTSAVNCLAPGGAGAAGNIGIGATPKGCPKGYGPLFSSIYKLIPGGDPCGG